MKLVMCHNCGCIEINNFTPYVDGGIYCDCEENKEKDSKYVDSYEQLVSINSER